MRAPERVEVTRPDKLLWPELGITKQAYVDYLAAVSELALPWLRDRPLTLVRAPDGVGGERYFQKAASSYTPDWIPKVTIPAPSAKRDVDFLICNDAPTLAWIGNQAALELHPAPVRRDRLDRPDLLVVDIDPPDGAFDAAAEVAELVLGVLDELGIAAGVKTTGGKGLHVVAPLEPSLSWEHIKGFTKAVAELLERTFPDRFTSKMLKVSRRGRIYIDYLRNAEGATAICAYSTRAKANAPVSAPIAWDELDDDLRYDRFNIVTVPDRMTRLKQDPWAHISDAARPITRSMMKQVGYTS
jgi:bifunctional non-homologous end joining protein LigD